MPKSTKPKRIKVNVVASIPRQSEFTATVEIDPDAFGLSDQPTVEEITDVAQGVFLDKLQFRLERGTGRETIAAIKAARASSGTAEG